MKNCHLVESEDKFIATALSLIESFFFKAVTFTLIRLPFSALAPSKWEYCVCRRLWVQHIIAFEQITTKVLFISHASDHLKLALEQTAEVISTNILCALNWN